MAFTADDQQAVHVRFSQKQKRHATRVVAQPDGHSRIELEEQAAVDLTQVTYRNASKKGKISRQLTAAGAVHATVTCPKTKREKNKNKLCYRHERQRKSTKFTRPRISEIGNPEKGELKNEALRRRRLQVVVGWWWPRNT